MSYYSALGTTESDNNNGNNNHQQQHANSSTSTATTTLVVAAIAAYDATSTSTTKMAESSSSSCKQHQHQHQQSAITSTSAQHRDEDDESAQYRLMSTAPSTEQPQQQQHDNMIAIRLWPLFLMDHPNELRPVPVVVYHVTQRTAGICGAVFNGIMTGSSLIPMHYAKKQGRNLGGAHYMISLAIGSLLSNILLWIVLYIVQVVKACCKKSDNTPHTTRDSRRHADDDGLLRQRLPTHGTSTTITTDATESLASSQQSLWAALDSTTSNTIWQTAYHNMPRWYFRQLYLPGIAAGILLALSMFGSIIAVTQLGQGIGNSVVQCKIIISGLWGIFYFAEIRGPTTIFLWFASAGMSVTGIIWLSQERLYATSNDSH
jgi:Transmembrane family, TMEM144 of transporters